VPRVRCYCGGRGPPLASQIRNGSERHGAGFAGPGSSRSRRHAASFYRTATTARIQRNIRDGADDVSWGPNNRFRFPLHGGTGAIWRAVAALLPPQRIMLGAEVVRVEASARQLVLADGRRVPYDALISTIPLDVLCGRLCDLDDGLSVTARGMKHGSVHVIGFGLSGGRPETLARKCWMYFPEAHGPYFRVTVSVHGPVIPALVADLRAVLDELRGSRASAVQRPYGSLE
jgi:protoporphyrinogen oxidase